MRTLGWLAPRVLVPVLGLLLLVWWTSVATDRNQGAEPMSWWAAVLLFGGFGLSAIAPRIAVATLYAVFLLQLIRYDCRFDAVGWLAYLAVLLTAVVLAVRTPEKKRRRFLQWLLPLGVLIGLFTNLPSLAGELPGDDPAWPAAGLVNGKNWQPDGYTSWKNFVEFGQLELIVGLLVWSVAAVLLIVAAWMIGSSYRARRLQWQAEADASTAHAALSKSHLQLRVTEERDRIAQDVHDITAHALSVIVAQADGLAAHAENGRTRGGLDTIAGSARSALVEIRTLLEHLEQQPDGDTTHSATDLPALVESVRQAGAEVEYREQGDNVAMSSAGGLAAYRIVQEALTNALRHGKNDTTPIRVFLDWRPDGLTLTVTSALTPGSSSTAVPGRGLVGMQQRARLAGGWLTSGTDSETASYLVAAFLPARNTMSA